MAETSKIDTWMPLFIDWYLKASASFSAEDSGACMWILLDMWCKGGFVKDDDVALSKTARLPMKKWIKVKATLSGTLQPRDGYLTNDHLISQLEKANLNKIFHAVRAKKGSDAAKAKRDLEGHLQGHLQDTSHGGKGKDLNSSLNSKELIANLVPGNEAEDKASAKVTLSTLKKFNEFDVDPMPRMPTADPGLREDDPRIIEILNAYPDFAIRNGRKTSTGKNVHSQLDILRAILSFPNYPWLEAVRLYAKSTENPKDLRNWLESPSDIDSLRKIHRAEPFRKSETAGDFHLNFQPENDDD